MVAGVGPVGNSGVHEAAEHRTDELESAVEHGQVDMAAAPARAALVESSQREDGRVDPGHHVADRDADPGRLAGRTGYAHQSGLRLHQHVVGLAVSPRAIGAVAGDLHGDEVRPRRGERVPIEPRAPCCGRRHVVDEDVGLAEGRPPAIGGRRRCGGRLWRRSWRGLATRTGRCRLPRGCPSGGRSHRGPARSTFRTSAPSSARIRVHRGPATECSSATTRTPASGPACGVVSMLAIMMGP